MLFFYTQLLEPPEEEWDGKYGAVIEIRERMGLPPGQKHTRMVRRALSAIAAGEGECGRGGGYEGSGGVPKLTMQEALIASRALRTGCGQNQATFKVNAWRQAKGTSSPSRHAGDRVAVPRGLRALARAVGGPVRGAGPAVGLGELRSMY